MPEQKDISQQVMCLNPKARKRYFHSKYLLKLFKLHHLGVEFVPYTNVSGEMN